MCGHPCHGACPVGAELYWWRVLNTNTLHWQRAVKTECWCDEGRDSRLSEHPYEQLCLCDSRGSPAVPREAVAQHPQANHISRRSQEKPHLWKVWHQHCVSPLSPANTRSLGKNSRCVNELPCSKMMFHMKSVILCVCVCGCIIIYLECVQSNNRLFGWLLHLITERTD